ncbi:hypothetical protein F4054_22860 [Candidatus Poribacteria bacterium]|nr:hypothetical protein [Candidatus Poribacteria bacterium]MYG06723.1 hypothetical protein [Candidatus Poribacteria bacterium]MYK25093.1 hypothetical protein [Candidatus Poribacteria bacterium]
MLNPNDTSKADNSQIPMLQPMGFGGILDATLSLYRNNFRFFLAIIPIYIVWIGLQEAVVIWLLEISNTSNLDNLISDVENLLDNLVYMFCVGVFVIASSKIYLGKPITFRVAFQQFRSQFPIYFRSSLLFLIPYTILTLESIETSIITLLSPLSLLSLAFLCVFYISWVFYGHAVLLEGFTAMEAFGRSRILVRGTWMRVCSITLAILLLEIGIYYILGGSLGVVFALLGIVQDGSLMEIIGNLLSLKYIDIRPTSLDSLIMYIVYLGWDAFTLPIYAIGVTLLYFDLRIRKEGFDIEMRVRNSQDLM